MSGEGKIDTKMIEIKMRIRQKGGAGKEKEEEELERRWVREEGKEKGGEKGSGGEWERNEAIIKKELFSFCSYMSLNFSQEMC